MELYGKGLYRNSPEGLHHESLTWPTVYNVRMNMFTNITEVKLVQRGNPQFDVNFLRRSVDLQVNKCKVSKL